MTTPRRKSIRRSAGTPSGAREEPAWLTPEARAEIAQAAAEWNAGTPTCVPDHQPAAVHDPEAAVAAIKAIHAAGPAPVDFAELLKPANLGFPSPARMHERSAADLAAELIQALEARGEPVPAYLTSLLNTEVDARAVRLANRKRAPGAGRPSKRSQYDLWAERRSGIAASLAKAARLHEAPPALGRRGPFDAEIRRAAGVAAAEGVRAREVVAFISDELALDSDVLRVRAWAQALNAKGQRRTLRRAMERLGLWPWPIP